ncbi:MAG: hypothetical protein R3C59_00270 [Planctomycetaceae bacterium]
MNRPDYRKSVLKSESNPKPYYTLGAGQLTAFLWKNGSEASGWRYRFNVFRLAASRGRVSQSFRPRDVFHFVKLLQVIASVLSDDGCLCAVDRGVLKRLAADIDALLNNASKSHKQCSGDNDGNAAHS